MRKLMISLVPDLDLSDTISNQTMKRIYQHMNKEKIYTRKSISAETGIPLPTVTARVAGMLLLNLIREVKRGEIRKI